MTASKKLTDTQIMFLVSYGILFYAVSQQVDGWWAIGTTAVGAVLNFVGIFAMARNGWFRLPSRKR